MSNKKIFMSVTASAVIASSLIAADGADVTVADSVAKQEAPWTVSKKHDLKVKELKVSDALQARAVDSALAKESGDDASDSDKADRPDIYTVESGDTISEIAYKFGISTEDLMKWNNLDSTLIVPGEQFALHGGESDTMYADAEEEDDASVAVAEAKEAETVAEEPVQEENVEVAQVEEVVEEEEPVVQTMAAEEVEEEPTEESEDTSSEEEQVATAEESDNDADANEDAEEAQVATMDLDMPAEEDESEAEEPEVGEEEPNSEEAETEEEPQEEQVSEEPEVEEQPVQQTAQAEPEQVEEPEPEQEQVEESTPEPEPTPEPTPEPEPEPEPEPTPEPAPQPSGDLISTAKSVIGTPYVWGGSQPGGFDCSGFIHWAHKESGNDIGRKSTDGYYNTSYIVNNPQVGDLVFFEGTYRDGISHMGIYLGGGQFIHAGTSNGVQIASVHGPYWDDHFHSYKRFY